ncbi:MAG: histidine kinase, partial [Mangrovimonas sp.]|nr:histidine kinase [Mangrovimonas sp.]
FTIRGSVIESDSRKPISRVNVEVNGGSYTTTNSLGEFRIPVKKGDEIIISHKDFETVYYTVTNQDRITVEVEPTTETDKEKISYRKDTSFNSLIDSAVVNIKNDANKSIEFVTLALEQSRSIKQNAEAYEVLADVFVQLRQHDLAVSNYRISLQNFNSNDVQLKLAKAYQLNKNYQESKETYQSIETSLLSNYQQVEYCEGLGDVYFKTKDYSKALEFYTKGLDVAKKHLITPKVVDLNSKIAEVYDATGKTSEAQMFYSNSLNLASGENKKRAVEEKIKVADFQSKNRAYEEEIQLRKEALEDIEDIEHDSIIDNESSLTAQKQNYKIGNAYYLQKDYDSAIPYFEKSIREAETKQDLVVQKDAYRKLSEAFRDVGNYDKALASYQEYVNLVETLYVKKEQELSQLARFNRDIIAKQTRINSLETDRQLSQSQYLLSNERSKRQEWIIYSLIGGLILLLVMGYFMFKYIRQQRLANNLLALKSLRSQMNPHFIFNALNSVNSFIASSDERSANQYLTEFSQLMRAVLENSEQDFIPLEKEIELLQLYTKLEHFRFKDKFDYKITVDETIKISDFQIPPMLLQPYIENAVWHGLRYKAEKGHLWIDINKKSENEITITIADDGIGRERSKELKTDNQKKQNSKGMGNIKKRVTILNEMYKDKVDVYIDDYQAIDDKGTKVVVTLKKD